MEVQIGNRLRTLRLKAEFGYTETTLYHPDVCPAFVECIGVTEPLGHARFQPGGVAGGLERLVMGGGAAVGGYVTGSALVLYQTNRLSPDPELAGKLDLSRYSQIAAAKVIEINTETMLYPDGTTGRGQSIQLHPAVLNIDETTDVVAGLEAGAHDWTVRPIPYFAGTFLQTTAIVALDHPGADGNDEYFRLSIPSFNAAAEIVREAVGGGNVQVMAGSRGVDQLFVPCLANETDSESDPLARLLSFNFGSADRSLYINVRQHPPIPAPVAVDGVQYCPTLLERRGPGELTPVFRLVPGMFEGNLSTFLDARNHRVVFRASPGPRAPLPVSRVPPVPSFDLPFPTLGSLHFVASIEPAWILMNAKPNVSPDGTMVYTWKLYDQRNAFDRHVETEYPGEYYLIGSSGQIDVSDSAMLRLPFALEGSGRRYRINRLVTRVTATYTVTPIVEGPLPPAPAPPRASLLAWLAHVAKFRLLG